MPFVGVTRARMRGPLSMLRFMRSGFPAFQQAGAAQGFLAGAVLRDRGLTFWTLTLWESEAAMRAYTLSGAHRGAMPAFAEMCLEASVAHWSQEAAELPSWAVAAQRMRREGRPSKIRKPGPHHGDMSWREPRLTGSAPIPRSRRTESRPD